MNSVAEEIRNALPGTEDILVEYVAGYVLDDAAEEEDVLDIARQILESPARGREAALDTLLARLSKVIDAKRSASAVSRGPKLQRLDKVMDMSKTGSLSTTIAFSEGVDLESINKAKSVSSATTTTVSTPGSTMPCIPGLPRSTSRNWKSRRPSSECGLPLAGSHQI